MENHLYGKQRYQCHNQECPRCTFILDYTYHAYQPEVKQKIGEMAVNGSGIRDTARVLKIGTHTVMSELKKRCEPAPSHGALSSAPRKRTTNRKSKLSMVETA